MGPQRRQDILAVAQKHGVPLFEDDCYVDLRFEGAGSPAIHSYDDTGIVLYSGSFSKTLAPGVRLGWLVAPPELVPRINALYYGLPTAQFAALATLYYVRDHGRSTSRSWRTSSRASATRCWAPWASRWGRPSSRAGRRAGCSSGCACGRA